MLFIDQVFFLIRVWIFFVNLSCIFYKLKIVLFFLSELKFPKSYKFTKITHHLINADKISRIQDLISALQRKTSEHA